MSLNETLNVLTIRRRRLGLLLLAALVAVVAPACSGPEPSPGGPEGEASPGELALGGGGARFEEAAELAQAIADAGVPSPTPELDSLAAQVAQVTPGLGLDAILQPAGSAPPPLVLQAGDRVEVLVFGREEFSGQRQIARDGRVQLGIAGSLSLEGQTLAAAATAIESYLVEGDFLARRGVDAAVFLVERAPTSVKVVGRVRAPGAIPLPVDQQLSLRSLVTLAQGLEGDADGARLALIREDAQAGQRVYHFSYDELIRAHLAGLEVWLQPEDQLIVPRTQDCFVYGAVVTPGRYPLRPGTTVASLVLQAGGFAPEADSRAARVLAGSSPRGRSVGLQSKVGVNEVVFVPQRQRVYLVGAGVAANGPIDLPSSGLTVIQALASAGWVTKYALLDEVEIIRYVEGRQQRIPVPLDEILDGDKAEEQYPLRPGDLVFVPESIW